LVSIFLLGLFLIPIGLSIELFYKVDWKIVLQNSSIEGFVKNHYWSILVGLLIFLLFQSFLEQMMHKENKSITMSPLLIKWPKSKPFKIIYISVAFFLFLKYTTWFANSVYPQISQNLGGGKPLIVRFFDVNSQGLSATSLIKQDSTANLDSSLFQIIFDDGSSLVISPIDEEKKIYRIKSSFFDGFEVINGK
ncbi:MAG: hypothetical protein KDD46_08930, partial [Bdellovibrionales bacterium]|nr:hypothetical protein [Bdellovibrionales bacterium]